MNASRIWAHEVVAVMQFHAETPSIYRCGDYRVHSGVMGWTAWNYTKRIACLVKDTTLAQALDACERDLQVKQLEAEFVKA